jgi:hypothetical protein
MCISSKCKKAVALLALVCIYWFSGQNAFFLHAQDDNDFDQEETPEEGIPMETDWDGYFPDLYSKGDQTFTITLGVIFPMGFFNNGTLIDHHFSPPVGGIGSLSYTYFLNSHYFLGIHIGLKFNYTLAENTVFIIPIGLHTGRQFILRRFEIPITAGIGFAPQRYMEYNYAGFFLKGGVSAFFRFSPEWSFGIDTDWNWYPQRPLENGKRVPGKDVDAHILGLTISARYHF